MLKKGRYFRSSGLFLFSLLVINFIILSLSYVYFRTEKAQILDNLMNPGAEIVKLKAYMIAFSGLIILAFNTAFSFFWFKQRNELSALEKDKLLLIEQFAMLSRFANDAIIVFTEDHTIIQVNDKALELYGFSRSDILGMTVEMLRIPEERDDFPAMLLKVKADNGLRFETVHMTSKGTGFPVEVSMRYMELMGSNCFQAVVRDITQRKQFEKALIASEERLKMITNTVPLIVWTATAEGYIDFVNSRFEEIVGFYPIRENATIDFIHPDDRERVTKYWQSAVNEARQHQIQLRILTKEGIYRWYLCMAMPSCNSDGKILRWFGSATDIDELENRVAQRTAEIKEHEKEIVKLNLSLQEHALSLENANKELEAFIYSVSHDLRAPLRAINGFSMILLDEYKSKLDTEGQNMLGKVWNNADRMRQLIDDLLRFSKTGRHALSITYIDMNALFNSMIEETKQLYPERQIKTSISEMPGAYGDLSLMKQVLLNLLSNAVKFSGNRECSEIEIKGSRNNEEICYYIKDNGTGFDMKYADELFGVFRRLNNAEGFEGTGVGLALVKRIIEKHGGKVWAQSEQGNGATFSFSLPDNR
ncbi:MAG TPA: PAS domain S-box protein [Bacteroidales bacterium]|nr:PAS domain S-box protein [Bacteroidales bacterium]